MSQLFSADGNVVAGRRAKWLLSRTRAHRQQENEDNRGPLHSSSVVQIAKVEDCPALVPQPRLPHSGNDPVRWNQLYLGLGITTLATLILELSLTRIFSVVFYYHFAFLAISIALFGLGSGGVFSYVVDGASRPPVFEARRAGIGRRAVRGGVAVVHPVASDRTRLRDAGRGLRRQRAAVLSGRDGGFDRHVRSHRARGPRLFFRSGGRGRRMPGADSVPQYFWRSQHRDRGGRVLRHRGGHLVSSSGKFRAARGGGAGGVAAGGADGGERAHALAGRARRQGRETAARKVRGVEQLFARGRHHRSRLHQHRDRRRRRHRAGRQRLGPPHRQTSAAISRTTAPGSRTICGPARRRW